MKVLLVEDDPIIARGLQVNLELEKYTPHWASDIAQAQIALTENSFDLILLDLGLPDGSGFSFLTEVRSQDERIAVIILTAQTDENSVVKGLHLGANDYVRKPFGTRELLARIKAVLRVVSPKEKVITFGEIQIITDQRLVKAHNNIVDLSRREFDILMHFIQRPEVVVTREALIQSIDKDGEIFDRTIDSHVSHLRNRLKQAEVTSIRISSVYGVGYRLEKVA